MHGSRALPNRAEVVVVGAGVVGLSVAYHLARLGADDVVVLEREATAGTGSTGRSAGGIRIQFSSEVNVRLSAWSLEFLKNFKALTGVDPGLRQYGYLILTRDPATLAAFEVNVAMQRSLGMRVRLVTPAEARAIVPQLRVDDLAGGTFGPDDGYADPHSVVQGLASKIREMGVRLFTETAVVGLELAGGQVRAVRVQQGGGRPVPGPAAAAGPSAAPEAVTPAGEDPRAHRVETRCVVNAAGPWAGELAAASGIDLPVRPYRRMVFVTEPIGEFAADLPMVIDFDTGFYARREGDRLIFGMADEREGPSFRTDVDWSFLPVVLEKGVHRLPALAEARVARGWAGLYEVSPDHNAIVGEAPGVKGLFFANGFSGHGFQQAPAVGRVLAEMILGLPPTIDVSALSPQRFRLGRPHVERQVV